MNAIDFLKTAFVYVSGLAVIAAVAVGGAL